MDLIDNHNTDADVAIDDGEERIEKFADSDGIKG